MGKPPRTITPTKSTTPKPTRTEFDDPVAFWRDQYEQSRIDSKRARDEAPSILDRVVRLERDAWDRLQSAIVASVDEEVDTSLEAQLRTAIRMRRAAESAGSHVAARQHVADERAIAEQIRARDEAAAKAARRALSPDELVNSLAQKIRAMPESMQARIRAALGWD